MSRMRRVSPILARGPILEKHTTGDEHTTPRVQNPSSRRVVQKGPFIARHSSRAVIRKQDSPLWRNGAPSLSPDCFVVMPFHSTDALTRTEEIPGFLGAFLHSDNMTVASWDVDAGSTFPEHAHPHEQISIVVEGEFELTLDGETDVLKPGRIAVIPADAPHSGRAVTDCKIIDVFSPVREDYQ